MSGKWQCPVCRAVVRCPPRRGATLIAAIAHHEALCTGVPSTRRRVVRILLAVAAAVVVAISVPGEGRVGACGGPCPPWGTRTTLGGYTTTTGHTVATTTTVVVTTPTTVVATTYPPTSETTTPPTSTTPPTTGTAPTTVAPPETTTLRPPPPAPTPPPTAPPGELPATGAGTVLVGVAALLVAAGAFAWLVRARGRG